MKPTSFLIAIAFAALTLGAWALLNRPTPEPPWPTRIQGFAFSPYQEGQDAVRGDMPSEKQIDADLALLAGKTNAVRTYSTLGTLASVPRLAEKHDINVTIGAWLGNDRTRNHEEVDGAIRLARENSNVVRVIIGNEVVLRGELSTDEVIAYLDQARAAIGQPVSTAEPWHVWLKHPELAAHVDFLAVHMLPYWEGIDVDHAVDYTIQRIQQLQRAFPDKPIILGEVGWPSNGRTRQSAVASEANEALFLRRFLVRAEQEKYIYYLMEAFDQPWKGSTEGAVGAYWGVYDVHRQPKFAFSTPIVRVPHWELLAAISVGLALFVLFLLYLDSDTLRSRGRSFLAFVVYGIATVLVWVFYDYSQQYLTATSIAVGVLLFAGMIGVVLVLLAEAHEWAEAHWFTKRRREFAGTSFASGAASPKVSIHVPAHDEPPDMVIETLDALARLDYPDYEVLVIDNNTRDEAVWRPVEAHCALLGARFRFFHVEGLQGFKAGALNLALRHTAPDAAIVAVIDSDYLVEPGWLAELVPQFADPKTGIVQAPQDYRDGSASAFKSMCRAEYRGFFCIGMVTRNERNAIIQHGTMTLVRRDVLERTGAWAEWCITEDAELGLRVLEAGFQAHYTPQSQGRGLMPDTFVDFKKQRYRWAYGAMQILKSHARVLLTGGGERGALSPGQRYHFVAGWLPWLADGFNLIFNLAALCWSLALIIAPRRIDPPLAMFSVLPLSLFAFKIVKMAHLYHVRVGASWRQTLAAALAGLSLAHTVGLATLRGILTRNEPFFRTPKVRKAEPLRAAFAGAREEVLIAIALVIAAVAVAHAPILAGPDRTAWVAMLVIQSVPYLCAVVVSLLAALPVSSDLVGNSYREAPRRALAPRIEPAPTLLAPPLATPVEPARETHVAG
jgi:exo-beta-1,3-glucanase (GH17 family)/cellulose synthase/poly-beta-1,6-N-acetylglucosamine synthase-like glycosyltransferase